MSLIIGNVLPLRDRKYVKAMVDRRDDDPYVFDKVMEDLLRFPHGTVVLLDDIGGAGSGEPNLYRGFCVRCDSKSSGGQGIIFCEDMVVSLEPPEEVQESGAWVAGQLQDGFHAVAYDPDAEDVVDVVDEIIGTIVKDGTVAGLPPLSMIEVHGPITSGGRASSESSKVMKRYMVVIGETGLPNAAAMDPVQAPDEDDDSGDGGGGDGPIKKAGSPGEALKAMLARRHAGKDLDEAERKWRGSRWRSRCPRPGSCR